MILFPSNYLDRTVGGIEKEKFYVVNAFIYGHFSFFIG